jgi:quinone-modifying oxidoreductase, subunit QmoC
MIEATPDIQFKADLRRLSNAPLNECIQCGTCSVVCSLAPNDRPFPRKEMIWAGWGMKDQLLGNPDIWLCHQCGDCSTYCPRDVKPADVIAAARQLSYTHYARPRFLGKLLSTPKFLPLAILLPVVVIAFILTLAGTFKIPEGPVDYSKFFPHAWLNSSFSLLTLIFWGMSAFGLSAFWKDMQNKFPDRKKIIGFYKSLLAVFRELTIHKSFDGCEAQKSRKTAHLLVFYGFILLLFVTAYAIIATVFLNYPLAFTNPFKILGNLASVMLLTGLGIMITNRIRNKEKFGNSNYSDWLFLFSLLSLTLSGTLVEIARFENWSLAYHLYFYHLCNVWFVIMYMPYIKFGHIMYRTAGMVFAKMMDRK